VFFDEHAVEYFDPDHSANKDRYLMLGLGYRLRLLVVSYALREEGSETGASHFQARRNRYG
jgi:uncharacterized DUF497 family protein